MEMRSLTRCLRTRPTTTPTFLSNRPLQFLSTRQISPFSSSPSVQDFRKPRTARRSGGSFDDIIETLGITTKPKQKKSGDKGTTDLSRSHSADTGSEVGPTTSEAYMNSKRRRIDIKLGPTLGREVAVAPERNQDLQTALSKLDITLNANKVAATSMAQRFHVRRGQRLKNLRKKRWRTLFKYSFTDTVNRINKMRRQGW